MFTFYSIQIKSHPRKKKNPRSSMLNQRISRRPSESDIVRFGEKMREIRFQTNKYITDVYITTVMRRIRYNRRGTDNEILEPITRNYLYQICNNLKKSNSIDDDFAMMMNLYRYLNELDYSDNERE